MSNRVIYNVTYDIPRVDISLPGRQNRISDIPLRVTPGMTEPIEFWFGNQDGVGINLMPFQIKLIFWVDRRLDSLDNQMLIGASDIVLSKTAVIDQAYTNKILFVLDANDTLKLGQVGTRSIRWSIFMINQDRQVFPAQVARNGARFGTVEIDVESGIPISELILSA